jgi:hypothetical protein
LRVNSLLEEESDLNPNQFNLAAGQAHVLGCALLAIFNLIPTMETLV